MFPLVPANRSPLEVETRHTAVGHARGGFIKCFRSHTLDELVSIKRHQKKKQDYLTISEVLSSFCLQSTGASCIIITDSPSNQCTTNHLALRR